MEYITYRDKKIGYEIVKSRIKNIYIVIKEEKAIIKIPYSLSKKSAQKILEEKIDWVYKRIVQESKEKITYKEGSKIFMIGEEYTIQLQYKEDSRINLELTPNKVILLTIPSKYEKDEKTKERVIEKGVDQLYLTLAQKEVAQRIQKISKQMNLVPSAIRYRKVKSIWGSCTKDRKITINTYLMQFPQEIIDYVIVHELAHIQYMNHSKDFWQLVEKYVPNYKECRKKLKKR